jgi:hypothetical protein
MSKAHHHGGKGAKGGKGSSSSSKGGGKGGSSSFFDPPPVPAQITRVIHADGDTRNTNLSNMVIVRTDGEMAVTDADLASAVRVPDCKLLRTQKGLFCRTDGAVVPTQVGEDGEPRPILGPYDA